MRIVEEICVLLVTASLLAACAAGQQTSPQADDLSECFWTDSIYDWRAIDDQHMIVWSPSRHCAYLVAFSMRCHGLRFTDEIAFKDRDGRICPFGGDAVIVPGPTSSRCTIATISRMTAEEVDIALKREVKSADEPLGTCERE